ncbi:MAG: M56 family metallopeptidase [Pseudomonadota bacterium]
MVEVLIKSLSIGALTYALVCLTAKHHVRAALAGVWLGFALLLISPWISIWQPYPATTVPLSAQMGVVISPIESPPHQRSIKTFNHDLIDLPPPVSQQNTDKTTMRNSLLGVWVVGALIMLALLIRRLLKLHQVVREATSQDTYRDVPVAVSASAATPFLWCIGRATIVLPAASSNWNPRTREHVLAHEYHHWKRRDGWNLLGANLVYALFWWHPFVRALVLANEDLIEEACDDAVVRDGAEPASYADTLLKCAHQTRDVVVAGFGGQRRIKHRIRRLLIPTRRSLFMTIAAAAVAPMLAAAVSVKVGVIEDPADSILTPSPVRVMTSMRYDGPPAGTVQIVLFYDGAVSEKSYFDIEIVSTETGAGFWARTSELPKFDTEVPMWELSVAKGYRPSGRVRVGGLVADGYVDGLAYGLVWRDHSRAYHRLRSESPTPVDYPNAVCHWPLAFVPTGAESGFFSDEELWQVNSIRHVICGAELVKDGTYRHSL